MPANDPDEILTTREAAALCGITPSGFRTAAATYSELRDAKVTIVPGRVGYRRGPVERWREAIPTRNRRNTTREA